MYSLNLMRIALGLAFPTRPTDIATKFSSTSSHIAAAINGVGEKHPRAMNERDGFCTTSYCLPDGTRIPLQVRSMVGLIPPSSPSKKPWRRGFLDALPEFQAANGSSPPARPGHPGLEVGSIRHRASAVCSPTVAEAPHKCLLRQLLDEREFLSDYGVRAVSKRKPGPSVRGRGMARRCRTGGGVHRRPLRRQFELAWPHLDAGELSPDPSRSEIPHYYSNDFKGNARPAADGG